VFIVVINFIILILLESRRTLEFTSKHTNKHTRKLGTNNLNKMRQDIHKGITQNNKTNFDNTQDTRTKDEWQHHREHVLEHAPSDDASSSVFIYKKRGVRCVVII